MKFCPAPALLLRFTPFSLVDDLSLGQVMREVPVGQIQGIWDLLSSVLSFFVTMSTSARSEGGDSKMERKAEERSVEVTDVGPFSALMWEMGGSGEVPIRGGVDAVSVEVPKDWISLEKVMKRLGKKMTKANASCHPMSSAVRSTAVLAKWVVKGLPVTEHSSPRHGKGVALLVERVLRPLLGSLIEWKSCHKRALPALALISTAALDLARVLAEVYVSASLHIRDPAHLDVPSKSALEDQFPFPWAVPPPGSREEDASSSLFSAAAGTYDLLTDVLAGCASSSPCALDDVEDVASRVLDLRKALVAAASKGKAGGVGKLQVIDAFLFSFSQFLLHHNDLCYVASQRSAALAPLESSEHVERAAQSAAALLRGEDSQDQEEEKKDTGADTVMSLTAARRRPEKGSGKQSKKKSKEKNETGRLVDQLCDRATAAAALFGCIAAKSVKKDKLSKRMEKVAQCCSKRALTLYESALKRDKEEVDALDISDTNNAETWNVLGPALPQITTYSQVRNLLSGFCWLSLLPF